MRSAEHEGDSAGPAWRCHPAQQGFECLILSLQWTSASQGMQRLPVLGPARNAASFGLGETKGHGREPLSEGCPSPGSAPALAPMVLLGDEDADLGKRR